MEEYNQHQIQHIPFSLQTNEQKQVTLKLFSDAVYAAGLEIGPLIHEYLTTRHFNRIEADNISDNIQISFANYLEESSKKRTELIQSLLKIHKSPVSNDRDRKRYNSILAPFITRRALLETGFVLSQEAFSRSRRHATVKGCGAQVSVGGRPRSISKEVEKLIEKWCNKPSVSEINPEFVEEAIKHGYVCSGTIVGKLLSSSDSASLLPPNDEELSIPIGEQAMVPLNPQPIFYDSENSPICTRQFLFKTFQLREMFNKAHPAFKINYQRFRVLLPKYIKPYSNKNSKPTSVAYEEFTPENDTDSDSGIDDFSENEDLELPVSSENLEDQTRMPGDPPPLKIRKFK